MRADRLVAALLVLQSRGTVTASALAAELEVSERTARRDLEALSVAGVPVYPRAGRGGGWSLVGGARTDLSGLTAAEARALFLVAGPSGATPEVKAALRKLVRALPETFRAEAEAAASAVVVDPSGWDHHRPHPPAHLAALQQAVIGGVQVRMRYRGGSRPEAERVVHPLGLVAKGPVWYMVANTASGLRTFRVSRIRSVALTGEPVERPESFDLEEAWRSTLSALDERRVPCTATIHAVAGDVERIRWSLGTPVSVTGRASGDRVEIEARGYSPRYIAARLAGFGERLEIVGPPEVREEMSTIAAELSRIYAPA